MDEEEQLEFWGEQPEVGQSLRESYNQYMVDTLAFNWFQQQVEKNKGNVDKGLVKFAATSVGTDEILSVLKDSLVTAALICSELDMDLGELADQTLKEIE